MEVESTRFEEQYRGWFGIFGKDRNRFLFEGVVPNARDVVERSFEDSDNWCCAQACDREYKIRREST